MVSNSLGLAWETLRERYKGSDRSDIVLSKKPLDDCHLLKIISAFGKHAGLQDYSSVLELIHFCHKTKLIRFFVFPPSLLSFFYYYFLLVILLNSLFFPQSGCHTETPQASHMVLLCSAPTRNRDKTKFI